ncbi:MAG: alpha-E domain-containing protein [Octadecabacter sp.]
MLGKTAGGLFWMFRYLERAENTARLIEAGFRIALTRTDDAEDEWHSVIKTLSREDEYEKKYDGYDSGQVSDFLLRDLSNPGSILSVIKAARDNARLTRTALTTEVWYAVNDTWMLLSDLLKTPIPETELPAVLSIVRQQSALVRGALVGTMLRNDIYFFCRLGTAVERMDNTARIIDVKNISLLPPQSAVGGHMDNVQWETLLRSVSAHRSFRWAIDGEYAGPDVAEFLILDDRMPRSLAFCAAEIQRRAALLAKSYDARLPSQDMADKLLSQFESRTIGAVFDEGLHNFLNRILYDIAQLAGQIEEDYRFTG